MNISQKETRSDRRGHQHKEADNTKLRHILADADQSIREPAVSDKLRRINQNLT